MISLVSAAGRVCLNGLLDSLVLFFIVLGLAYWSVVSAGYQLSPLNLRRRDSSSTHSRQLSKSTVTTLCSLHHHRHTAARANCQSTSRPLAGLEASTTRAHHSLFNKSGLDDDDDQRQQQTPMLSEQINHCT